MNTVTLSIDQLLRAAQLIEQNAIAAVIDPSAFTKFGEGYQERLVASKMRTALCLESGSTGSSRRSSPTSMISAQSSAPNSPAALLVPAGTGTRASSTSSGPVSMHSSGSPLSGVSTRQSRAAHNELEKNRRANLRGYLDSLKSVLPPDNDTSRDTTLSLLTRARNHIRSIKEQRDALLERRNVMLAEHVRLTEELEKMQSANDEAPMDESAEAALVDDSNRLTPPAYLEYSPSCKPSLTCTPTLVCVNGSPVPIDLYAAGLVPELPLLYPYPYLDDMKNRTNSATNAC